MSWADEPAGFRTTAERVCTPKELDVLKLKSDGYGRRRGALMLDISETTYRERMRNALRKIEAEHRQEEVA